MCMWLFEHREKSTEGCVWSLLWVVLEWVERKSKEDGAKWKRVGIIKLQLKTFHFLWHLCIYIKYTFKRSSKLHLAVFLPYRYWANCFHFLFFYLFWLKEGESKRRGGAKRKGDRIPSTLSAEPDVGLNPTILGSWPEPGSRFGRSTDCAPTCFLRRGSGQGRSWTFT